MKIPREIDELMWEVADNRNDELLEQFRSRYPEFACELEKRIQMVTDLKGSRPSKRPENFRPRERVRNLGPSRLAVAAIATFVLFSLSFAAYALVQYTQSRHIDDPMIRPNVIFPPPSYVDKPTQQTNDVAEEDKPANSMQVNPGTVPPPIKPQEALDPYLTRVSIESQEIGLQEAIVQISEEAGLHANVLPGFDDLKIRISYIKQPAMHILEALGKQFGFTPMRDGTVDVLIVPTRVGAPVADSQATGAAKPTKSATTTDPKSNNDVPKDNDTTKH